MNLSKLAMIANIYSPMVYKIINSRWLVHFIRQFCRDSFFVLFLGYLLLICVEYFFPGVVSRTIDISNVFVLTIIFGLCLLFFPHEVKAMRISNSGTQRTIVAFASIFIAFALVRMLHLPIIFSLLFFIIIGATVWYFFIDLFAVSSTDH